MTPITHPFDPICAPDARVLILGSFPSVKSREEGFYYGHPRNRFWQVLADIFGEEPPGSIDEKRAFLIARRIALWDVCAACEIEGSADASIREAVPNDIPALVKRAQICAIFTNGTAADTLLRRHFPEVEATLKLQATKLPSTSPANAVWTRAKLADAWAAVAAAARG